MNLRWNVYVQNFNNREIEEYNILSHPSVLSTIKELEKRKLNRHDFFEELDKRLRYLFWVKCEWEIILSGWPQSDDFDDKKIDVYSQIKLNWDVFCNYVWSNRDRL